MGCCSGRSSARFSSAGISITIGSLQWSVVGKTKRAFSQIFLVEIKNQGVQKRKTHLSHLKFLQFSSFAKSDTLWGASRIFIVLVFNCCCHYK